MNKEKAVFLREYKVRKRYVGAGQFDLAANVEIIYLNSPLFQKLELKEGDFVTIRFEIYKSDSEN